MDLVQGALMRAPAHAAIAMLLALVAGIATSIGPCVAPRYLAVAGIARRVQPSRRNLLLGAFIGGTVLAYSAIAGASSAVTALTNASSQFYLLLAATLLAFGIRELWLADRPACSCEPEEAGTLGGAFLLGFASSLIISPCCTPALLAFGSAGLTSTPLTVVGLVLAFSVGHLSPLVVAFKGVEAIKDVFSRYKAAGATINGGITIALGLYYLVLA